MLPLLLDQLLELDVHRFLRTYKCLCKSLIAREIIGIYACCLFITFYTGLWGEQDDFVSRKAKFQVTSHFALLAPYFNSIWREFWKAVFNRTLWKNILMQNELSTKYFWILIIIGSIFLQNLAFKLKIFCPCYLWYRSLLVIVRESVNLHSSLLITQWY